MIQKGLSEVQTIEKSFLHFIRLSFQIPEGSKAYLCNLFLRVIIDKCWRNGHLVG